MSNHHREMQEPSNKEEAYLPTSWQAYRSESRWDQDQRIRNEVERRLRDGEIGNLDVEIVEATRTYERIFQEITEAAGQGVSTSEHPLRLELEKATIRSKVAETLKKKLALAQRQRRRLREAQQDLKRLSIEVRRRFFENGDVGEELTAAIAEAQRLVEERQAPAEVEQRLEDGDIDGLEAELQAAKDELARQRYLRDQAEMLRGYASDPEPLVKHLRYSDGFYEAERHLKVVTLLLEKTAGQHGGASSASRAADSEMSPEIAAAYDRLRSPIDTALRGTEEREAMDADQEAYRLLREFKGGDHPLTYQLLGYDRFRAAQYAVRCREQSDRVPPERQAPLSLPWLKAHPLNPNRKPHADGDDAAEERP